jgi:dTMP kinase
MPLIVFEGSEGVGKTTQVALTHKYLWEKFPGKVIQSQEPGGTPLAQKIREIFKSDGLDCESLHPLSELHLLCAARNQHVQYFLKPQLGCGNWVICDRFLDSTYVYQCLLNGLSKELVDSYHLPILNGFVPDLTIVLGVDPPSHETWDTLRLRLRDRESASDRYDGAGKHIHLALLRGYQELLRLDWNYPCGTRPHRIFVNALNPKEIIASQIQQALEPLVQRDHG